MTEPKASEIVIALQELRHACDALLRQLDTTTPLIGIQRWVRVVQGQAERFSALSLTEDQLMDLAVQWHDEYQSVQIHSLPSYRAPDSPEGLT